MAREDPTAEPNGDGAAAILGAGVGALALGVLALASDAAPAVGKAMGLYRPSGALSGVSTGAVLAWLAAWALLARRWRGREVALGPVNAAAIAMLATGLLLTFPPVMDVLTGG